VSRPMSLLADQLLSGVNIALTAGVAAPVGSLLAELGAHVEELGLDLDDDDAEEWARSRAPLHALVYDAGPVFGDGGETELRAALAHGWTAVRAIANGALIPSQVGGKVALVGPRPDAGPHADAARAGLENLARTLSVEWARYGITATAIAPGPSTIDDELALLVAFIASRAGDYLSGCRFELGAIRDTGYRES
jgi:NAD(P)-dependent dehydrogenase (short-subunit alcohol dehydrogenase family)